MILAAPPAGEDNPVVCDSCGADEMGCEIKANYSGRRCCGDCSHIDDHGVLAPVTIKEITE